MVQTNISSKSWRYGRCFEFLAQCPLRHRILKQPAQQTQKAGDYVPNAHGTFDEQGTVAHTLLISYEIVAPNTFGLRGVSNVWCSFYHTPPIFSEHQDIGLAMREIQIRRIQRVLKLAQVVLVRNAEGGGTAMQRGLLGNKLHNLKAWEVGPFCTVPASNSNSIADPMPPLNLKTSFRDALPPIECPYWRWQQRITHQDIEHVASTFGFRQRLKSRFTRLPACSAQARSFRLTLIPQKPVP